MDVAECIWAWGVGRFAIGLHVSLDGSPWTHDGVSRRWLIPFRMDHDDPTYGHVLGLGEVAGKYMLTAFWVEHPPARSFTIRRELT